MNNRKFSRIIFNTKAELKKENLEIQGEVENLSMNGAFIKTNTKPKFSLGESVEIVLSLTGSTSELTLNLKGQIKRIDEEGIALSFTSIDLDSFTHLKNILAYNSGEQEKIMDEFYQSKK